MPWQNWYSENFDTAPTGKIVGYDGWGYAGIVNTPNNSIESGVISSKYAATGQALSCEVARLVAETALVVNTVAGNGVGANGTYTGDGGLATSAGIARPYNITVGPTGDIFFSDNANSVIRKVAASTGIISTFASSSNAQTQCLDPAGQNLYIVDTFNCTLRKKNLSTLVETYICNVPRITTPGWTGYNGNDILAIFAELNFPMGVAVDTTGNIYITSTYGNIVRKIKASDGKIITIAGGGGSTAEGVPALTARFNNPAGLFLSEGTNELFIADLYYHRVRKLDLTLGLINTIAGTGTSGYNGDGIPATSAKLFSPMYIYGDSAGNIYIADSGNSRIRKVGTNGKISTVVGSGVYGIGSENVAALSTAMSQPLGIFVDTAGDIYYSDTFNHRVRKAATTIISGMNADQTEFFVRGLNGLHDDYEASFDFKWGTPLLPNEHIRRNTVTIKALKGNSLQTNWAIQFSGSDRSVQFTQFRAGGSWSANAYPVDLTSAPLSIKVRATPDGVYTVTIPSISVAPLWTTAPADSAYRGIDRLGVALQGVAASGFNMGIDNISLRYVEPDPPSPPPVPPPTPTVIDSVIPGTPQGVYVNSREAYNVLSWNEVTTGTVHESISRAATGDVDFLSSGYLITSPIVSSAVIDGATVKQEQGLPKEGMDFDVNRGAGSITWRSGTDIKRPATGYSYEVHYDVPITGVMAYNVYKSSLLNEYDRSLYKAVTGLDFNGALDTAIVDTAPESVAVYRVASVSSTMVESELSEKTVAIRISTQADTKTEVIDRKLFTLDQSLLDEGLVR